jgi:hypothetical protein
VKPKKSFSWADIWPFAILAAYFLVGLFGHYVNMTFIQPQ